MPKRRRPTRKSHDAVLEDGVAPPPRQLQVQQVEADLPEAPRAYATRPVLKGHGHSREQRHSRTDRHTSLTSLDQLPIEEFPCSTPQ